MVRQTLISLVVVLAHLMLIMMVFRDPNKKNEVATEPEVGTSAAPTQNFSPNENVAFAAAPMRYSDAFFVENLQPLPTKWANRANDCRGGVAVDFSSRTIYWAKEPLQPVPIASMTKMMTAYLAIKEIEESRGQLSLATVVPVTVTAAAIGGRKVWLDPRETFTIDELLKCMLIRSANDCAFLLGEFLGKGSEGEFVARMNKQAADMGLHRMLYRNTHGLPSEKGECMGAPQELAFMAGFLMEVPEIVKWSSVTRDFIREKTDKKFNLDTTNSLLRTCPGVNGMKTGMTNKAGYCIAVTCERQGRQVVVVLTGCQRADARDNLARELVEWVYTL